MNTPEGREYYDKWLHGDVTCKMVRERLGCGLLAKFLPRKVDEEEDQKMLGSVLQVEQASKENGHDDAVLGHGVPPQVPPADGDVEAVGAMKAPTMWPSYTL